MKDRGCGILPLAPSILPFHPCMNRLIRIALTLFAAASLLVVLVSKRLEDARNMVGGNRESEIQMAYLGIGLAGGMLIIGLGLIITAFIRSRKARKSADHG